MKFRRLDLAAFGPFTDVALDFSGGPDGLHMVYGPNEAGKSSALRALCGLLFGIPHVCPDDFIHPYNRLRIGAELEATDGRRLAFVRLKGKSNTLRTPDESEPLEEARLADFTGGMTEARFLQMFGIDHARLIQGGEEIIRGGGEMGQILFAGGAGIANLRTVQDDLGAEADALFRPSAQKPALNAALSELKTVRQAMCEAQLSAGEWSEHIAALETALAEKERLTAALAEKMRERSRLERIGKALPAMGRRRELQTALAECADAPRLPADFPDRRREAQTALRMAESDRDGAEKSLAGIRQALETLTVDEGLLAAAETVESLYQELGSVRKAEKDRRRLVALKESGETDARGLLKGLRRELTLEEARNMRLDRAEAVRIGELGGTLERLLTQSESRREEAAKLESRIERLRSHLAELGEPPDPTQLKEAMEAARAEGNLQEIFRSESASLERDRAEAAALCKRLGAPGESLERVGEIPLPEAESIDLFETRLAESQAALDHSKTAMADARKGLSEIAHDLQQLEMEGAVPSESDLATARRRRDAGWILIRDAWLQGADRPEAVADFLAGISGADDLAGAYEMTVREADDLSDRLRREADRVARKAALQADEKRRTEELAQLEAAVDAAQTADAEARAQWEALWTPAGVTPRTPREMRPWRQNMARLTETAAALRERAARRDDIGARIADHERTLRRRLNEIGEPPKDKDMDLDDLLRLAARHAASAEKRQTARDAALRERLEREGELREIELKSGKTEADLAHWRSEWGRAIAPLGLDEGASPAQANAVLEDLRALMAKLRETDVLRKRIQGIDRDAAAFHDRVAELTAQVAPDLEAARPEEAMIDLNRRLTEARSAATERKGLTGRLEKEEKRHREAGDRSAEIRVRLSAMCEEAGCPDPEALPAVEGRSRQRAEIERELAAVEERLRELSGGAPIETFLEDADAVDPDSIEPRTRVLTEEIDALEARKSALDQAIGQERTELKRMDGGDRAAELASEAEGILAKIRSDAEHYIRLKLASAVLHGAIERYREKHQGPILKRSESLFSRMTLGSFEGLRLEFTEKGEAILVGVRPGGKETVGVGGMSEGTADQLYLAVRLASLEAYLSRHEPMPFIVDDILIQFDDRRAAATLEILAELSENIQVIFFTHHRHLVELAQGCLPEKRLWVHSLSTPSTPSTQSTRSIS